MTYREITGRDLPELRAPRPDEHGGAIDCSITINLLRQARASQSPSEQKVLRKLAKVSAGLWKPEELNNLKQRLLEDEELWDEIPALLEG